MAQRAPAIAAVLILLASCSKKEPELIEDLPACPMRQLTNDAELIAEGSLVSFDVQSRKAVLRLREAIQGQIATAEVEVDFNGGMPVATESLWRHLVPGMPIVWLSAGGVAMVYLNRFFVLCYGDPVKGKWAFTSVEIRANGTYNGPVKDLGPLLRDIVSGRPSPPPDLQLKPITIAALRALPVWGEPVDEDFLPACFRRGTPAPLDFRTPENPVGLVAGLRTVTFLGPLHEPPNFDAYDALEKGVADSLTIATFPSTENLRVRFEGYLDVPKDGVYVFILARDPRPTVSLRIGTTDVVASARESTKDRGGDIALKAGKHAFRLSYSAYIGERSLQVLWSGPGFTRRPIPASALFRDP